LKKAIVPDLELAEDDTTVEEDDEKVVASMETQTYLVAESIEVQTDVIRVHEIDIQTDPISISTEPRSVHDIEVQTDIYEIKGVSVEVQTDAMVESEKLEEKPLALLKTFCDQNVETDALEMEAELATVKDKVMDLEEQNMRLLQELEAAKLMITASRSQTQQMKILKEAAEARFEQLARVAHRKLVRAMLDKRE